MTRVEPEVTEYRQHTLTCRACGAQTPAEFPAEMPSGSFGPRVQATMGHLMSQRNDIIRSPIAGILGFDSLRRSAV